MPHRKYSLGLRWTIVNTVNAGVSYRETARRNGISTTGVSDLMSKFRATGDVVDLPRSGRPLKTTVRMDRQLKRMAVTNRTKSGPALARDWGNRIGVQVSAKTAKRRLKRFQIHSRRPRKGVLLTQRHKTARLQWARLNRHRNIRTWRRIYWTDESRYGVHHVDGRIRVWRRSHEKYLPECMIAKVQGRGGTLMVWGGFSHDHKLPLQIVRGNMNSFRYRDEILDTVVRPHFQAHAHERPILMDDNAPAHRAGRIDQYKATHNIVSLDWPALSPDLNPVEHIWDWLQRAMNAQQPPVNNLADVQQAVMRHWARIPVNYMENLVRSMPRRCQAVIDARGGHTPY